MSMFERITPIYIIRAHLDTIRSKTTKKLYKDDIFLLFGIPIIIGIFFIGNNLLIEEKMASSLLTILSISVPLLFSLLVLIYDMGQNIQSKEHLLNKEDKLSVANSTSDNVSFMVFLSIIIVIILGVYLLIGYTFDIFTEVNFHNFQLLLQVFSLIIYWLLGVFILTLLMVLKRTQILISSSFPPK